MSAATLKVTVREDDTWSSYPWAVDCSECQTIIRRSTRELAEQTAKAHAQCDACGGHCEDFCSHSDCLGHCEGDECYACGERHCDEYCNECDAHAWCDYCNDHCYHHHPECEDCHQSESGEYDVQHYGYKPDPIFHGEGKLFVGMELEVTWPDVDEANGWISEYVDGSDLWYAKEDSSVPRGFELVTHPMSVRWARRHFPYHALDDALRHGAIADDKNCGTHIHVSRAGLTGRQWWTLFAIHRKLPDLCGHIGGRGTDSEWARWDQAETLLARPIHAKHHKLSDVGVYPSRYVPLNVQNTETVELRYPAGDFSPRGVKRNLQWVEALTTFGQDRTCRDISVTEGDVIEHIERNPSWSELKERVATY